MAIEVQAPESLDSLLALLQKEADQRRKNALFLQQLIAGLAGGYVVVALILFIIKGKLELSSILSFTSLFACLAAGVSMTSQHRQALSKAAQWQDPRVIPHLIEALDADNEEIKKEAKAVLKSLLPKLLDDASPGITLNLKQRQLLTGLCRDKDAELAEAAVKSLGVLGDEASLKTLDEIGKPDRNKPGGLTPKISALAMESAGNLRLKLARQIVEKRSAPTYEEQKENQGTTS